MFISASISLVPLVDCSECIGHHNMTEVCLCLCVYVRVHMCVLQVINFIVMCVWYSSIGR